MARARRASPRPPSRPPSRSARACSSRTASPSCSMKACCRGCRASVGGEPFDRRDRAPLVLDRQGQARQDALAVDQHRAGAAGPLVASLLGAREPEPLPQNVEQALAALQRDPMALPVDRQVTHQVQPRLLALATPTVTRVVDSEKRGRLPLRARGAGHCARRRGVGQSPGLVRAFQAEPWHRSCSGAPRGRAVGPGAVEATALEEMRRGTLRRRRGARRPGRTDRDPYESTVYQGRA